MSRKITASIRTARVYEPPKQNDGHRILVDRIWPRGVKKDEVQLDGWMKDVAPSTELRRWFGHDPGRWREFRRRYFAELDSRPQAWRELLDLYRDGVVTLLYAAKDEDHNNAVALQAYLEGKLRRSADRTTSFVRRAGGG